MPRVGREQSGTGIYHVMLRGINCQDIFEEPEDYWTFIRILSAVHECPTTSFSICGKTMKNNDSKFNQTCPSDWADMQLSWLLKVNTMIIWRESRRKNSNGKNIICGKFIKIL